MKITFNNTSNTAYEAMFNDLIQEVFGFSFAPWFECKPWDNNYESYSVIEDSQMLSNVCIFKSELLINGEKTPAIQFGAVATRKSARGRGLSRYLMAHVLSLYPNTPAYLFANAGVVNFYPKFGFHQVQTYNPEIQATINNASITAVKCNLDDAILQNAISNRNTYSNLVDCTNSQSIQMFHLMMSYANDIYYLPHSKVIVIATKKGDRLFIADIIAQQPLTFDTLAAELPFTGIHTIAFGFNPDWLGISPTWKPTNMKTDPFFIKGDWKLPEKFCIPITSTT